MNFSSLICVDDVEKRALKLLAPSARDYYASGADEEQTLKRNIRAFRFYVIRPFALRDVSALDTSVSLFLNSVSTRSPKHFQHKFPYPFGIAPTAFQKMADVEGELATVSAAGETNTPMICSTLSTTTLEDIAEVAPKGTIHWFQLYIYKDRALTEQLVRRAESSGYSAIVLTVDAPVMGRRRTDERNKFVLPPHLRLANFVGDDKSEKLRSENASKPTPVQSGLAYYSQSLFDSSLNWDHLRWLIGITNLPVIVKGIMRADDALRALEAGASAIYVSNHGGRQLDHCAATIEALPGIAAALKGRCPVFLDGGIRCGTDIFKALALGADFVFVGRPIVYGLAVGGKEGVKHVITLLRTELDYALKLAGLVRFNIGH